MRVEVTLLRREGLRLKKRELASPVVGELVVGMETGYNFKRALLVAHLRVPRPGALSMMDSVLPALFDVALVAVEDDRFTLQGIHMLHAEGRFIETVQLWRCRPLPPSRVGESTL